MILVLAEGDTEENALNKLKSKNIIQFDSVIKPKNSQKFRRIVVDVLSGYFEKSDPLSIVILRDLDSGKSVEDVKKSTEDAIKEALKKAKIGVKAEFLQYTGYQNIFCAKNKDPDFAIVLHIAQRKYNEGLPVFKNCTTDDYVLDLALRKETIENLPEFVRAKRKNPELKPEEIQNKIKKEIFSILKENGIEVEEAKSFVNLYIAVLQLGGEGSMRYKELPGKIIEHARKEDVEEVFRSWITTFTIVGEGVYES